MADDEKVMVLRDGAGNLYALPWDVMERALLPAEVATAVEEATGGDVTGFSHHAFFNGRLLTSSDLSGDQSYLRGTGFDLNQHLSAVRLKPSRHRPDND